MELNSPAGDADCLKAAVLNRANAVYLGIKAFNARRLADNFSIDDLRKAVRFAHLHGSKIFLTMNTLVRNEEMELWFKTLEEAYIAGIDAVIIQELWLAKIIKTAFPGLQINASTQASLMNYHGINSFKDIDLAVLARELDKEEIREIRKNTGKKLEVFVHGHQCISYSGQCLISSLIGKRSGNRGVCASSCRKRYNGSYLISPKDLMLADSMDELCKLGIDSVKIEGRMKSPEYVAITTKTYRKQIDAADKIQRLNEKQLSLLKMGFNRDFTPGFFSGAKSIIGKDMPMNRGILLGTVYDKLLRLQSDLKVGDGVGFFNPRQSKKLHGFVLRKMYKDGKEADFAKKGDFVSIPSKHFTNGTNVYITSKDLEKELNESLRFKHVDIEICQESGFLVFKADDAVIRSDIVLQEAKQHPFDLEQAKDVLMRSREIGVIWDIKGFEVPKSMFMPISKLGKMRQDLEDHLLDKNAVKRQSCYEGLPGIAEKRFDFNPRIIVKVYDVDSVAKAEDAGAYAVHFDIFNEDVMEARRLCKRARFFLDTPVILTDSDIKKIEEIIRKVNPDGIVIGNWGLLDLDFKGEKHGKYSLNVFNDISVGEFRKRDIIPTISVELNAKQVMKFKDKEFIYYADGNIPVMHFKGEYDEKRLEDELGYVFPLRIVNHNTEMLYSRPIAVLEHAKELADAGIRYFLLDLADDVGRITRAYASILAGEKKDVSHLKEGTTLGNYNKGVA